MKMQVFMNDTRYDLLCPGNTDKAHIYKRQCHCLESRTVLVLPLQPLENFGPDFLPAFFCSGIYDSGGVFL